MGLAHLPTQIAKDLGVDFGVAGTRLGYLLYLSIPTLIMDAYSTSMTSSQLWDSTVSWAEFESR